MYLSPFCLVLLFVIIHWWIRDERTATLDAIEKAIKPPAPAPKPSDHLPWLHRITTHPDGSMTNGYGNRLDSPWSDDREAQGPSTPRSGV